MPLLLLIYVPLYDIDLVNSSVLDYREVYSKRSGQKLPRYVVPMFVLMIVLFGGFSLWTLRKRPAHIAGAAPNGLNSPSARARRKAVHTILIPLTIALVSYLPAVIQSRVWLELENQAKVWFAFVIYVYAFPTECGESVYYLNQSETFFR